MIRMDENICLRTIWWSLICKHFICMVFLLTMYNFLRYFSCFKDDFYVTSERMIVKDKQNARISNN